MPPAAEPSHWTQWHAAYDDPDSPLSRRLAEVQRAIVSWLDRAPAGPLSIISCCAGQGRDLVGALAGHPRVADVQALLVEADAGNVAVARGLIEAAGLGDRLAMVEGDASVADAFAAAVPADLVVLCGVFGNISDEDIERTIRLLPTLCAPGAVVVWTRHRRPPDRTGDIRQWFADAGFAEVSWCAPEGFVFAVGVHRLEAAARPFEPTVRLFDFVGDGARPA